MTVEATSGYYNGLFMLARINGNSTAAFGTFTVNTAAGFKLVDCYSQTGVGHENSDFAISKYCIKCLLWKHIYKTFFVLLLDLYITISTIIFHFLISSSLPLFRSFFLPRIYVHLTKLIRAGILWNRVDPTNHNLLYLLSLSIILLLIIFFICIVFINVSSFSSSSSSPSHSSSSTYSYSSFLHCIRLPLIHAHMCKDKCIASYHSWLVCLIMLLRSRSQ